MKKITIILLLLISLSSFGQTQLLVSGMVMENTPIGMPVPDQEIILEVFSGGALMATETVYSNNMGFYDNLFDVNTSQGEVIISTIDCDNSNLSYTHAFFGDSLFVYQELLVCGDTLPGGCMAYFDYVVQAPLSIQFINQSEGGTFDYFWDFGDGETSNELSPMHTYTLSNHYQVILSIVDSTTGCFNSYTQLIQVGDSIGGNCRADFDYFQEPNMPATIQLMNYSTGNPDLYQWDFGDGSYSNEINPEHTYQLPGYYTICLTISSNDSSCFDTSCQSAFIGNDTLTGCQAEFSYFPIGDSVNPTGNAFTYQFIDMSFGAPVSWSWEFGDGLTSNQQNPVHTYSGPGLYDVCLFIEGEDSSCFSSSCQLLVIENDTAGCVAQFVYYPDSLDNAYNIQFQDLSYGNISNWFWEFGDGQESTEQNPVHSYNQEGSYTVCLTISGPDCQSVWCEEVWVFATNNCYNYFTYQTVDNSVAFSGVHSTTIPASYLWDFGNGETGEGQEVTHTYNEPGMYYVSLVTNDDNQCSAVSSQLVVVGDSIEYHQVYGQIFEGDLPLDQGFVMIFSLDTTSNYNPYLEVCPVDSNGVFYYPYVPSGDFLLYAVGLNNDDFLPTYYGNVINWEEASVITLGEPNNPYDIHLVETTTTAPIGNGSIDGQIANGKVNNSYLDAINVLIYNSTKEPIGYTEVDADGNFNIEHLGYGTYYLYPELSGILSQMIRIEIEENQPQVSVNMTFDGGNILGFDDEILAMEMSEVYPNPVLDQLNVKFNLHQTKTIEVKINGLDGRLHLSKTEQLSSGNSTLQIPVGQLSKGVYILQVSESNQATQYRKFIR